MSRLRLLLLLGLSFLLPATLGAQDTVAFKTGTLIVSPEKSITNGVLLVSKGKVIGYGANLPIPSRAKVVDLPGTTIAPGMVDIWTQTATAGETREVARPLLGALQVADALNLSDRKWKFFPLAGITSVVVAPDPAMVAGGRGCLVKTGKQPKVAELRLALQLSLASNARSTQIFPSSLPGQVRLLRQAFKGAAKHKDGKQPVKCPNTNVAIGALKGEIPVSVFCNSRHEVSAAAALCREFKFGGYLVGNLLHRQAPEILTGSGLGVALLPPGAEATTWQLEMPGKLVAAGVPVAFCSGVPHGALFTFRLRPATAIRYGMKRPDAFRAVTTVPAKMVGLDHAIGSLEEGRDADFLVLSGHPLNPASRIRATYIEGTAVFGCKKKKPEGKK